MLVGIYLFLSGVSMFVPTVQKAIRNEPSFSALGLIVGLIGVLVFQCNS